MLICLEICLEIGLWGNIKEIKWGKQKCTAEYQKLFSSFKVEIMDQFQPFITLSLRRWCFFNLIKIEKKRGTH